MNIRSINNSNIILNKTFARRIGKKLSVYNKNILENVLPKYQYANDSFVILPGQKVILEIGFGSGEHLLAQAISNPGNLYIGVEVYLNGVANFLKAASVAGVDNFLLWPDNLDEILFDIPDKSLTGIYILFPDPWHKRRYLKKRLVNKMRLEILKSKLIIGGFLIFASDIEDYFGDFLKLITSDPNLILEDTNFHLPHYGYVRTKYHQKAIDQNRDVGFLRLTYVE